MEFAFLLKHMHKRHNIRLKLAYDGTHYLGWQKTPTGPSIEETLQRILERVLQEPIQLQAASRTDAGVHAHGQVVNFFTSREEIDLFKLFAAVNGLLPKDIVVINMEKASSSFHPTLDCISKEYHYKISLGPVCLPQHRYTTWHYHYDVDIALLHRLSKHFIGTHDFAAFCNAKKNETYKNTIRHIENIVIESPEENLLIIKITGKQFLYKMVRNIVGTLTWAASGRMDYNSIEGVIRNKDRTLAGITAPPQGLTLFQVNYQGRQ
jgi:tRNA pseudouridine38-40 synthase